MVARPIATLIFGCAALASLRASAMTLEDALVRAYQASPRLASAQARLRAIDEGVPVALAGGRPRLIANSSAAMAQTSTSGEGQTLASVRQALVLSQPVYTGGAVAADTSRAENSVRAERARLRRTEQDLLLDSIDVFTTVARDQAVLDLAQRNERRLEQQLAATRDRNRFGELTLTDVAQAETRMARARADRTRAEGELSASQARFLRIIGVAPDGLTRADPLAAGPEGSMPPDLSEVPDVEAAAFALAEARDDIDLAKAQLKPRLSLDGEVAYEHEPSTLIDQQGSLRFGASVVIPFYQGGGEYAGVRRSRQAALERRNALDDARRQADEALAAATAAMRSATARIGALQIQTDRAAFALEGVRQEALVGARSVLDILNAEQELFAAEVELAAAQREEVVASYRLAAAEGRLDVVSLGLAVEPYDVEAHYGEVRDKWFGLGDDVEE